MALDNDLLVEDFLAVLKALEHVEDQAVLDSIARLYLGAYHDSVDAQAEALERVARQMMGDDGVAELRRFALERDVITTLEQSLRQGASSA
jgi:hypothetical protein